MRIDKYLKVSRLIKRRTLAKEFCDSGRIFINGKVAKSSTEVKEGDIIEVKYGAEITKARILSVKETVRKEESKELYEMI